MKKIRLLVIGQFSLVFGIFGFLINYLYLNNNPIIIFVIGILLGLSLVLNLTFLLKSRE